MSNFWQDRIVRHALFATLVNSSALDSETEECTRAIDAEIVSSLRNFGIPRGELNGIQIDDGIHQWLGRKDPNCVLHISREQVRFYVGIDEPDAIVSTWVHESIHARQRYADGDEYAIWTGYEEGLTEGLTNRLISSHGINDVDISFPFFVTAYEEIAAFLGINVETLWRGLWHFPTGTVRASFVDVIDQALRQSGQAILTERRKDRLRLATDTLFATLHRNHHPDRRFIVDLLKRIVQ